MINISLLRVARYLLIIITPLLIILANFNYLAFNKNFFEKIQRNVQSYLDLNERIYYTNNVISYYQGNGILDQKFYSYQAQVHLKDVKNLLNAVRIIIGLSIISILSLITIIVHEKDYESIFTSFVYGSIICLVVISALGMGLASYFDSLFLQMHKILFTNTLWLFSPNDTLIQVFPGEFFVFFAKNLVINTVRTCLLLLVASFCGKIYIRRHAG